MNTIAQYLDANFKQNLPVSYSILCNDRLNFDTPEVLETLEDLIRKQNINPITVMVGLVYVLNKIISEKDVYVSLFITDDDHLEKFPQLAQVIIGVISALASANFISSGGKPRFGLHELFECACEKVGLSCAVRKGEGDSFGWLTGVVRTPVGKIVYG